MKPFPGTWALVPVKGFSGAKSRLSSILPPELRAEFSRSLLEHVLNALSQCHDLAGVLVITDCPGVSRVARRLGARSTLQRATGKLNAVVDEGLEVLSAGGADAALVLMADLPWLRAEEIRPILRQLQEGCVIVVPDESAQWTNALGVQLPGASPTAFGQPGSFQRHCELALESGRRLEVVRSVGLCFDVDSPEDLLRLRASNFSSQYSLYF